MSKKRDSAYYEMRLRKEHPVIFAALKAGSFTSVRKAAIAAGLVTERGHMGGLKRHWLKASIGEQKAFIAWARGRAAARRRQAPIVDSSGMLTTSAANFLYDWTKSNRLTPGRIMLAIGFKLNDYRLAEAMKRRWPINPTIVAPLAAWMHKNGLK